MVEDLMVEEFMVNDFMVEDLMVEEFMVNEFMIEDFVVDKSMVEAQSWQILGWNVQQPSILPNFCSIMSSKLFSQKASSASLAIFVDASTAKTFLAPAWAGKKYNYI